MAGGWDNTFDEPRRLEGEKMDARVRVGTFSAGTSKDSMLGVGTN